MLSLPQQTVSGVLTVHAECCKACIIPPYNADITLVQVATHGSLLHPQFALMVITIRSLAGRLVFQT